MVNSKESIQLGDLSSQELDIITEKIESLQVEMAKSLEEKVIAFQKKHRQKMDNIKSLLAEQIAASSLNPPVRQFVERRRDPGKMSILESAWRKVFIEPILIKDRRKRA